ncbi:MAG: EamA family transporter [Chitinivibrionales bacterium]|nr:EamA family transporter [Chitinivibrionales bacterium]
MAVSVIWAFSFGLIKNQLTGLDSNFVSFVRMGLSFIVLLPFLRLRPVPHRLRVYYIAIGMVQYGIMYTTYMYAFHYLKAYQVALFTIFTPLYVTLFNDVIERRLNALFLVTSVAAIFGTAIVVYRQIHTNELQTGFLLLQLSNISFAVGQVFYKKIRNRHPLGKDRDIFALLYGGGAALTLVVSCVTTPWTSLQVTPSQALTLAYLGVIASGVCFFLWNIGAVKTNIGGLAIANNLKVPLAVACSILFFHEQTQTERLLIGGAIVITALIINEIFSIQQAKKRQSIQQSACAT